MNKDGSNAGIFILFGLIALGHIVTKQEDVPLDPQEQEKTVLETPTTRTYIWEENGVHKKLKIYLDTSQDRSGKTIYQHYEDGIPQEHEEVYFQKKDGVVTGEIIMLYDKYGDPIGTTIVPK